MAEEIAFENGRISNSEELVTIMHHSSTFTCMPNFTEIEETYCGRTYRRTGIWRPSLL